MDRELLQEVHAFKDRVPPLEYRLAVMYLDGRTQQEMAEAFKVVQPAVSYRLRKLVTRLALLKTLPPLDPSAFKTFDPPLNDREVHLLTRFWQGCTQSDMGRELGKSQTSVRFTLLGAMRKLREAKRFKPQMAAFDAMWSTKGKLTYAFVEWSE